MLKPFGCTVLVAVFSALMLSSTADAQRGSGIPDPDGDIVGAAPAQVESSRVGRSYTDPRLRYTVSVPRGWSATQLDGDMVRFTRGKSYVTLMILPSPDVTRALDSIVQQAGRQMKNVTPVRQGPAHWGGMMGQYITCSATNPQGVPSFLQILAASDGTRTFLLLTEAPQAVFSSEKPEFDQIETSFKPTSGDSRGSDRQVLPLLPARP